MGWDEPRCVWCHKTGGTIESLRVRVPNVPTFSDKEQDIDLLVHTEHRDETRRYYVYLYNNARTFLLTVIFGVIALIIFTALNWESAAITMLIYFGVVIIVFPFSNGVTFEVASITGIKQTVRFVQIAGAAFILGGSLLLII